MPANWATRHKQNKNAQEYPTIPAALSETVEKTRPAARAEGAIGALDCESPVPETASRLGFLAAISVNQTLRPAFAQGGCLLMTTPRFHVQLLPLVEANPALNTYPSPFLADLTTALADLRGVALGGSVPAFDLLHLLIALWAARRSYPPLAFPLSLQRCQGQLPQRVPKLGRPKGGGACRARAGKRAGHCPQHA